MIAIRLIRKSVFIGCILTLNTSFLAYGATSCFTAQEASQHVGESSCVCGNVVSTKYATNSNSQPTFLNLDEPFPNQIFTIVIFGRDRDRFSNPENTYLGKRVCVHGAIETYRGRAEIIVTDPSQIK